MALGMLGVLAIAAGETREALWAAKGAETRHLVETAHSLVADYQQRAARGRDDRDSGPAGGARPPVAASATRRTSISGSTTWPGTMLMHPTSPQLVGHERARHARRGRSAAVQGHDRHRLPPGCGLYRYYWPPNATARLKQSYVKGVSGWNWVIGSGVYVGDVQAAIRGRRAADSPWSPAALHCCGLLVLVASAGARHHPADRRADRLHAAIGDGRSGGRGAGTGAP